MQTLRAELPKINGSLSWLVVLALPILAVLSGSIGTLTTETGFGGGWDTLWIRSIGFYGMALLPVGVAILASLTWRVEHQPGNWNALMSQPVATFNIVASKAAVIALLAGAMQLTMLAAVSMVGKLGLGLAGFLPTGYWLSSVLVVVACVPVAVLQSLLSMVMTSFALPVALALIGTGVSTAALMIGVPGALLSPYALVTHSTQLGTSLVDSSSTVFNASALTPAAAGLLAALAVALTAGLVGVTTSLLNRRDLHS